MVTDENEDTELHTEIGLQGSINESSESQSEDGSNELGQSRSPGNDESDSQFVLLSPDQASGVQSYGAKVFFDGGDLILSHIITYGMTLN